MKRVYIGADHAGVAAKERVKRILSRLQVPYEDLGVDDAKVPADYPDIAASVGRRVAKGARGILICGSGTGMVMAANRIRGVRAALGYDVSSARTARQDNDANVLCLRGRGFPHPYDPIIKAWLETRFSGAARHKRRIKKLMALR